MLPYPDSEERISQLALSFLPNVGPKTARAVVQHFGSARDALHAPLRELMRVNGLGEFRARAIKDKEVWDLALQEFAFMEQNGVRPLWIDDADYPARLRQCLDAPLLLFCQGNALPDAAHVVAVVGTRNHTAYGLRLCEELIEGLKALPELHVVSGLAYGIDALAHKQCLKAGIPNTGVLAHGLDRIYPPAHAHMARDMQQLGGLMTEFPSGTKPDRTNFPVRNRVVAGLSDVTVVVESSERGGAMITAYLAAGYNREVAAFPGRVHDSRSEGCNKLIRMQMASLITSADDLLNLMGWQPQPRPRVVQPKLMLDLPPAQQRIMDVLREREQLHTDELMRHSGCGASELASQLLELELQGLIKGLPGKFYRLG